MVQDLSFFLKENGPNWNRSGVMLNAEIRYRKPLFMHNLRNDGKVV